MADGNSWFFGPTTDAVEYFNKLGYICPQLANPADFFMTMAYQSSPDGDAGSLQVDKLADAWRNSEGCKALAKEVANPARGGIDIGTVEASPGFCEQFAVLFVRDIKNTLRNKLLFAVKIGQTFFLGTLVGAIYANVEDTQKGVPTAGLLRCVYVLNVKSSHDQGCKTGQARYFSSQCRL
eukprot:SAG31_NODE_2788_length_5089_cov_7.201002_3_plen_180_part_00